MALKSGNHADAAQDGKSWTCAACGSESMDYQLFEELGDIESCIEKYGPPPVEKKMPEEELVRAARAKIYELGQAAQYAEGEIKKITKIMSKFDANGGVSASAGTHTKLGPTAGIMYIPSSMDYRTKPIEYKYKTGKYIW